MQGCDGSFPAVAIHSQDEPASELPSLRLRIEDWDSPFFNFYDFDFQFDGLAAAGACAVILAGAPERLPRALGEVLTRCQRHMDRRNAASRGMAFDRVLAVHREMHDLAKPLVRADWNHALDTWQWTLRLEPEADLAAQFAALFHDVERLATEADARIEHRARGVRGYQGFKDDHARRGAEQAAEALAAAGVDPATAARVARLIAGHEHPPAAGDPEAPGLALLNDADALSFFSLNSVGYLDYFGPEPTRRKVAWTLRRLRPAARRHLDEMRLVPAVRAALAEQAPEENVA
ncbi:MAG: DUF4202 family protein [Acidobacteria bacterium]|nr:DUF4202 family protein [Acidobacteriota bacterium]